MRNLILGASYFSVGVALYLAVMNSWNAMHGGRWTMWGYAMSRVGYAVVVSLVAELVLNAPSISATWRAVTYLAGLLLCAGGFIIIALDQGRFTKRGRR